MSRFDVIVEAFSAMPRLEESDSQQEALATENKHVVHEFCESTSIHGLKYIFEEGSALFERFEIP